MCRLYANISSSYIKNLRHPQTFTTNTNKYPSINKGQMLRITTKNIFGYKRTKVLKQSRGMK